jgi:hypothetical protein
MASHDISGCFSVKLASGLLVLYRKGVESPQVLREELQVFDAFAKDWNQSKDYKPVTVLFVTLVHYLSMIPVLRTTIDGIINNRGSQHQSKSEATLHSAVYLSSQTDWAQDPRRGKYSIHVFYIDNTLSKGYRTFDIQNSTSKTYNPDGLGADIAKALANPVDPNAL